MRTRDIKATIVALGMLACSAGAIAEDATDTSASQTEAIKAETERLKAQKALVEAREELLEKQIAAIGLPSTENKTTISADGAVLEATQLGADAMIVAGRTIADKTTAGKTGRIILLSADDPLDLTLPDELGVEIEAFQAAATLLDAAAKRIQQGQAVAIDTLDGATGTLSIVTAAAKAVAGLIGTDTKVSKITLSGIDSALLVKAVAADMAGKAVIPAAIVKIDLKNSPLHGQLLALDTVADGLPATRAKVAKVDGDDAKTLVGAIDRWIERYTAFRTRIATPDKGLTPLAAALRMEAARQGATGVLRLKLDHGAGSLIEYKNLGTFFGSDPIRVSGGLVASYLLTEPATGTVTAAGVVTCRTALAKLRDIQRGRYVIAGGDRYVDGGPKRAACTSSSS